MEFKPPEVLKWKALKKELHSKTGSLTQFGFHKLGSGSFSRGVYRAKNRKRGVVAVKVVTGKDHTTHLEREAQLLLNVKHKHIVECYATPRIRAKFSYLILEYVEGCDLLTFLSERTPPLPRQKLTRTMSDFAMLGRRHISRALLLALEYLHKQGIVHNDVKPENIVIGATTLSKVNDDTLVKLVDFGLACLIEDIGRNNIGFAGSLDWCSPEKISGDVTALGCAGDIYSFGLIVYSLMTSHAAYHVPTDLSQEEMYILVEKANNRIQRDVVDGELGLLARTDVKALLLSSTKFLPAQRKTAEQLLEYDFFLEMD